MKERPPKNIVERIADLKDAKVGQAPDFSRSNLIPREIRATTNLGRWAVEFFRFTGVINREERDDAAEIVGPFEKEFDNLPDEEREGLGVFLGNLVMANLGKMNEVVTEYSGTIYSAQLDRFKEYIGYVISRSVGVVEMSLPDTS